jgi:N-acyl homoserine lactone hydrolase
MNVHAIRTGTVEVRSSQTRGVGTGTRRQLATMFDRRWLAPLPILAFVIEHPEGLIVVDTGETALASQPGYFPSWHPYFRRAVRVNVSPEDEIGPAMRRAGLDPADTRWVVLTHMHTDHAGGLSHFKGAEIVVSATEMKATAGLPGRIRGYMSNHYPDWLAPRTVELPSIPLGPFPESMPLTSAGDVSLVGLAGHTPGHVGVLLDEGEQLVLFAGDASYDQELMLEGVVDGVAPDEDAHRRTLGRIRALAGERPTVYLPSHDADSPARLAAREPVPVRGPAQSATAESGRAPGAASAATG